MFIVKGRPQITSVEPKEHFLLLIDHLILDESYMKLRFDPARRDDYQKVLSIMLKLRVNGIDIEFTAMESVFKKHISQDFSNRLKWLRGKHGVYKIGDTVDQRVYLNLLCEKDLNGVFDVFLAIKPTAQELEENPYWNVVEVHNNQNWLLYEETYIYEQ